MTTLTKSSDDLYTEVLKDAKKTKDGMLHHYSSEEISGIRPCTQQELLLGINELLDHSLIRPVKQDKRTFFLLREKQIASNMSKMSEPERMVFEAIENSHREGIWIKKIKTSTNIPPNDVQKAVAKMEKLGFVKAVRSVRGPSQRIYMLAHLAPSEEVTGGSFFDAGELDLSMVEELYNLIIFHVRRESWYETKRRIKRQSIHIEDDNGHKRPRESIEDDHGASKKPKHESEGRSDFTESVQLAYPAGKHYPTTEEIHEWIVTSGAMRQTKKETLSVEEIQGLIDVLIWDEKLEKIRNGYRTIRGVEYKPVADDDDDDPGALAGNGLTDVPCGRCQITNICQDGTRVSAATCAYYQDWLTS